MPIAIQHREVARRKSGNSNFHGMGMSKWFKLLPP